MGVIRDNWCRTYGPTDTVRMIIAVGPAGRAGATGKTNISDGPISIGGRVSSAALCIAAKPCKAAL